MNFLEIKNWHNDMILEKLSENLKKRDFQTVILKTKEEISNYILKEIPIEAKVGIGGSVTVREIGIDSRLRERGNTVYDHWDKSLTSEQVVSMRKKQLTSDFFLTSSNAVTIEGQLVNMDGAGNRVSSMIFGPGRVISIIGINKIARNIEEAVWRIQNIATPKNCKRLGLDTPCVKNVYCANCKASKSVCRITTIIDYRPSLTSFTIILAPLELGY